VPASPSSTGHAADVARHRVRAAIDAASCRAAVDACRAAVAAALRALDHADAAHWYRRAVGLAAGAGLDPAEHADLLLGLAEAEFLDLRVAEALRHCVAGADLAAGPATSSAVGSAGAPGGPVTGLGRPDLLARAALVVRGIGGEEPSRVIADLCVRARAAFGEADSGTHARVLAQHAMALAQLAVTSPGLARQAHALSERAMEMAHRDGGSTALVDAMHARETLAGGPSSARERMDMGQTPHSGDKSGLRIRMDPGCMAELQELASAQDRWDVYRAVSAVVARHYPSSATAFQAAVHDASGDLRVPEEQSPFAEVARAALAQARFGQPAWKMVVPAPPKPSGPAYDDAAGWRQALGFGVFLSYAEEDWEVARQITAMLRELGIDVYNWQGRRGGQFIREIERAISQAYAFIALISPHYLASQWCRHEWEFALQREHDLQADSPDLVFNYVLKVADTLYAEADVLHGRDWLDMTSPRNWDEMLAALVSRLTPWKGARSEGSEGDSSSSANRSASLFRDRRDELDRVLYGLTNVAGPHFWLVVAPPQLGKSWFLDQLRAEITAEPAVATQWATKLVDLRLQPSGLRRDARSF
jgi:TIR domain